MDGAFPGGFLPILRMQNAALPQKGKSLLLESVQGSLAFRIAVKQMRRLSDPIGDPRAKIL